VQQAVIRKSYPIAIVSNHQLPPVNLTLTINKCLDGYGYKQLAGQEFTCALCPFGEYSFSGGSDCSVCPPSAVCSGGSQVYVQQDHWSFVEHRAVVRSDGVLDLVPELHVLPCPRGHCCYPGPLVGPDANNARFVDGQFQCKAAATHQCAPTRTGILCGGCLAGLSEAFYTDVCQVCDKPHYLFLVLIAALGLGFVAFLLFKPYTSNISICVNLLLTNLSYFYQVLPLVMNNSSGWLHSIWRPFSLIFNFEPSTVASGVDGQLVDVDLFVYLFVSLSLCLSFLLSLFFFLASAISLFFVLSSFFFPFFLSFFLFLSPLPFACLLIFQLSFCSLPLSILFFIVLLCFDFFFLSFASSQV